MTEKVTVFLRAVGDAPILKQKKFTIDPQKDVAYFSSVVRKMLQLAEDKCLFFYVAQSFSPSPDHTFEVLRNCYGDKDDHHLDLNYSTTQAWG